MERDGEERKRKRGIEKEKERERERKREKEERESEARDGYSLFRDYRGLPAFWNRADILPLLTVTCY